jgi:hypothetical protein
MQRRVRAFAQERSLPPAEIAKLMYKRVSTNHAMAFSKKYNVSLEWLLCGDLKGLQKMTKEASAEAAEIPAAELEELQRLYRALNPQMRPIALGCLRELMVRRPPPPSIA